MDIGKLKTELETDPERLGYSGMNDKEVTVAINEVNRSYVVPLSSRQMLEWAMQGGRLSGINDATNTGPKEIRAIAIGAMALISREDTEVDLAKADHVEMIDGLISGGVLTAGDKAELLTMATKQQSRADEIGFGRVREGDIQRARA